MDGVAIPPLPGLAPGLTLADAIKAHDAQQAPDDKPKPRDTDKLLQEARERFDDVCERDQDNKDAALKDTKFVYVAGQQWPEGVRKTRESTEEACLEFPQLKQFVNQVVNDQRQNRPGIRVHPAGGKASKDVATLIQGLVRGIEYDSSAEAAYDTGFQAAVVGGRGYWRICSKYESDKSFDQKLVIERIADPNTVWIDADFQMPDASDINYAFVTERIGRKEFEQRYPDADAVSWSMGNASANWYPDKDSVIVADYYRRVCKVKTLLMMSDGRTGYFEDMPHGIALPPGVSVKAKREAEVYTVEWYKIAGGDQVLETYAWPGTMIPVICCMGDEIMVDGKRLYQGLIRQAHDAQRMYNYEQSAKVMRYALAPKAPFIGAVEAIAGYENEWKSANKLPYSMLPYHAFDAQGRPLPPPQRTQPAPMEAAWEQAAQQSKADMKSVIGMYENSLGLHGQETSGRAILAREKQGDNSTFHFVDNLSRAIALTGKIIVECIPTYYDAHRIVTIVGLDDARTQVQVNQPMPQVDPAAQAIVQNDLTVGQYAVTVEAGPSYATKRQETQEFISQLVQSYPPLMQVAGDLLVGNMDFADADEVAERLKALLPPPIQQQLQAKEGGQDPQVAAIQQQMQQLQQKAQQGMQAMQQQLQGAMGEVAQMKQQLAAKADQANASMTVEQLKTHATEIKAAADVFKVLAPLLQTLAAPQVAQDAQILAPAANQAAGVLSQ